MCLRTLVLFFFALPFKIQTEILSNFVCFGQANARSYLIYGLECFHFGQVIGSHSLETIISSCSQFACKTQCNNCLHSIRLNCGQQLYIRHPISAIYGSAPLFHGLMNDVLQPERTSSTLVRFVLDFPNNSSALIKISKFRIVCNVFGYFNEQRMEQNQRMKAFHETICGCGILMEFFEIQNIGTFTSCAPTNQLRGLRLFLENYVRCIAASNILFWMVV